MKSFIALSATLMLLAGCATTTTSAPPAAKAPPPPPVAAGPNVTGTWALIVESPMGANPVTATFKQDAGALTGKMSSERGDAELTGNVDKSTITFSITINAQGTALKIDYTGQITGDTMAGTVKFGDFGEGKWSGKKS